MAVVDETGKLLDTGTIYPHPPVNKWEETLAILGKLVKKHQVSLISIGNGTASRETETLVAELIHRLGGKKQPIVSSVRPGLRFIPLPNWPKRSFRIWMSQSGARSRLPVGFKTHWRNWSRSIPSQSGSACISMMWIRKNLSETLGGVVESCVNYVGVDLNTASPSLLQYVAGLQPAVAKNVIAFRDENGKFKSRAQLKKVKRLGDQAFVQAAGFLKITDGEEPLDATSVHPESYEIARKLLKKLGFARRIS